MALNPYVKSLFWLISFSSLGYGLMILSAPSEDERAEIAKKTGFYITEEEKKKVLLLRKLKEAANIKSDN